MRNGVKVTHVKRPFIRVPHQAERSYYEVHQGEKRRGEIEYTKGQGWVVIPDMRIGFDPAKLFDGKLLEHPGQSGRYFESKDAAVQRLASWCELTDEERHADYDLRARRAETQQLKETVYQAWETYEKLSKLGDRMYRAEAKLASEQAAMTAKVLFTTLWNAYRAAIPPEDASKSDHVNALTVARAEALGIDIGAEVVRLKQARD